MTSLHKKTETKCLFARIKKIIIYYIGFNISKHDTVKYEIFLVNIKR